MGKNTVLINLELDICYAYKINARYIFPSLNFYYKPKKQSKTKTKIEYYNFITTYENRVLYYSKWVKSNVFCVLSFKIALSDVYSNWFLRAAMKYTWYVSPCPVWYHLYRICRRLVLRFILKAIFSTLCNIIWVQHF